jgi:hypothetical protein
MRERAPSASGRAVQFELHKKNELSGSVMKRLIVTAACVAGSAVMFASARQAGGRPSYSDLSVSELRQLRGFLHSL